MIKEGSPIIVFGYAKQVTKSGGDGMGFFNGVQMTVLSITTQSYCTHLICREYDLNENTVRDWMMHIGQVREV